MRERTVSRELRATSVRPESTACPACPAITDGPEPKVTREPPVPSVHPVPLVVTSQLSALKVTRERREIAANEANLGRPDRLVRPDHLELEVKSASLDGR